MQVQYAKFDAIESLRGWMAWWVVLGHAIGIGGLASVFPGPLAWLLAHNEMAVQVFMIVSGFVIAHLLTSRSEPYRQYIMRRAFRLLPLYFVVLAIAIVTRDLNAIAFTQNP